MTFHVFVYGFLGLAPLAQLSANQFPLGDGLYSDGLIVTALVHILVGVVFYEIGRAAGNGPLRVGLSSRLRISHPRAVALGYVPCGQARAVAAGSPLSPVARIR